MGVFDSAISFEARAMAYYPTPDDHSTPENRLEGGPVDRRGNPLCTLQGFLAGATPYVSVAMDRDNGLPYGTVLVIPALNSRYARLIPFLVVDTGSAFRDKGLTRLDICVADKAASLDPAVNATLDVIALR